MSRRYAILGTGALGGYYGARLAHAGCDVHFLLHSDYGHVLRHGLRVTSPEGDFSLDRVQAYDRAESLPPCDVSVVAIKTTHNHLLPELLPGPIRGGGCVLTLQNGLGGDDDAARVAGANRVVGGLAFLCSNKVGPGAIQHLDYGRVMLAEYTADGSAGGITPRMRSLASDFERAGVPVQLSENLRAARWHKLVWNIPFNGLCVALRADTREILSRPVWRRRAEALMREVIANARACGCEIRDDFADTMLADTEKMIPYLPSMRLDFDAGREMEVESIFGNPLRTARAAGQESPLLAELYEELRALSRGS